MKDELKKPHILLVGDRDHARGVFAKLLDLAGFNSTVCSDLTEIGSALRPGREFSGVLVHKDGRVGGSLFDVLQFLDTQDVFAGKPVMVFTVLQDRTRQDIDGFMHMVRLKGYERPRIWGIEGIDVVMAINELVKATGLKASRPGAVVTQGATAAPIVTG